ncbi:MAG: TIGR03862 family flavoprotein, partial [Bosea sp. (in: a-proteobacteria)]
TGFDANGMPVFARPDGTSVTPSTQATLLALGGASWPRLGSDGAWVPMLENMGVPVAPLKPANCGIEIDWSPMMVERGAGQPLKRIAIAGGGKSARGEAMITAEGLEGGAVYAILDGVRDQITRASHCALTLDLKPDRNLEGLTHDIARTPADQSTANRLRKGAKLDAAAMLLLNEVVRPLPREAAQLAALIKSVPMVARGVRSIERAISTAGGVPFEALTGGLMVMARPGLFVAGEMLDWEAPTGGYLLQGCFASAAAAADGVLDYLGDSAAG